MSNPLDKMAENERELGIQMEPAQQEPVAYGMFDTMLGKGNRMMMVRLDKGQDGCTVPLYTSPAQRTWVGLTIDEVESGAGLKKAQSTAALDLSTSFWAGARWAEAKLKAKNSL